MYCPCCGEKFNCYEFCPDCCLPLVASLPSNFAKRLCDCDDFPFGKQISNMIEDGNMDAGSTVASLLGWKDCDPEQMIRDYMDRIIQYNTK